MPMSPDDAEPADVRRIERALASGEPAQTADALRELADRRRHAERIAVAFPGEEVIDVTGPGPNEELLLAFCELVRDFGAFVPQLSWTDSIRIVVEAMLQHGGGQSAHDVAMSIKTDGLDPVNAAREAIWSIWRVGLPDRQ